MRLRVLLLCAVTASAGLGVIACSEKEPPAAKQSTGELESAAPPSAQESVLPNTPAMARVMDEPPAPAQPTRAQTAAAAPRSPAAASGRGTRAAAAQKPSGQKAAAGAAGPVAPANARVTILVYKLSGAGHVEQAQLLKQDL